MFTQRSTTLTAVSALALAVLPATGDGGDAVDASAFDYDADAPLNVVEGEALDHPFPDADVHPITYDSPGGEVTGYIAYPREGNGAGIIAMHGMPETAAQMIDPLVAMSCLGATAIAIDAPYARAGRGMEALTFTETDRDEAIQLVVDLRRAVDVLEAKGVERITYDGVSWSADAGAVLAGVEPRIDGFAIMVGSLVVDRFVRNGNHIDALAMQPDVVAEQWLDVMATVSGEHFVGDATAPIYFQNNSGDVISTPEHTERLHAAAGPAAEVQWYDDSPDEGFGHEPSPQMVDDHLRWQADILGLDPERVDECLSAVFGEI